MVIQTRTEDTLFFFPLNFVPLKKSHSFIPFLSQAQTRILSLACSGITWFQLQTGGVLVGGRGNPGCFRQHSETNSITCSWPTKTTALGLKILIIPNKKLSVEEITSDILIQKQGWFSHMMPLRTHLSVLHCVMLCSINIQVSAWVHYMVNI